MVLEFRKDPTKDLRVIIANERGKRPTVFGQAKIGCPFDKGAEPTTPPTKYAHPSEKAWNVRCFDNSYALLKTDKPYEELTFARSSSYAHGEHEVIVETSEHDKLFHEFSEDELMGVFFAYAGRFVELEGEKGAKYVLLFKNHRRNAGASIEHEHSQIVSFPFVPEVQEREMKSYQNHFDQTGNCLYCDLITKEKGNILLENDSFTAICPSFSRFAFEVWILPRKHTKSIAEFTEKEATAYMGLLQECLRRVFHVLKDYNVVYHNAVKGEDFHFHAEIYPRSGSWAGVELGAGVIVNQKSEADALKALKAVHPREEDARKKEGFLWEAEARDLY